MIVWCLVPFSTVFQLHGSGQCTYPCLSGVLLTNTTDNILSKALAAFSRNHCGNNRQWRERNESCRNDYHQSLERILAEPGTSDLLFSSPRSYQLSYGARQGFLYNVKSFSRTLIQIIPGS